jgi:antitoxin VapB
VCARLPRIINLSQETEALAKRLAAEQGLSVEDAIRLALEEKARAAGVDSEAPRPRRRMSVEKMLAVDAAIAAMPVLDPRSPREIWTILTLYDRRR